MRVLREPWLGRFGRAAAREVLVHVLIAAAASVVLFSVVEVVEAGNLAVDTASIRDLAMLTIYGVPRVLRQMLPVAGPLGALTAAGAMIRRGELGAVLASGASPAVILKPVLVTGALVAVSHAALVEWAIPPAMARAGELRRKLGLGATGGSVLGGARSWFKGREKLYRVTSLLSSRADRLGGVLMLEMKDGRVAERTDVATLVHTATAGWIGEGIVRRTFTGTIARATATPRAPMPEIGESPADFVTGIAPPDRLPLRELFATTLIRERLGRPAARHRLELYRRVSVPLALALSMVLAACLAFRLGRRQTLALGLGAGCGLGFAVWLLDEVGRLLGASGTVAAGPAAALAALAVGAGLAGGLLRAFRRTISE